MAVSILFRKKAVKVGLPDSLAALTLDATLSESHVLDSEVTAHPVERGVDPIDHIRTLPEKVTVDGLVTNTPNPTADDAEVKHRSGTVEYTSRSQLDVTRAGTAFSKLEEFREKKQLLTLTTPLKTYDNMVMTGLTVPRNIKDGECLRFTATFQRVRVVQNQTIELKTALPKGKGKVKRGQQQGTQVDDRSPALKWSQETAHALGVPVPQWLLTKGQEAGVVPIP